MDISLVPSFWPVAAAINGIRVVCDVHVTVLDRMNLFSVHDMAIQLVPVWKNGSEKVQQPATRKIIVIRCIICIIVLIIIMDLIDIMCIKEVRA